MGYNTTSVNPEGGGNPEKNSSYTIIKFVKDFDFHGEYSFEQQERFINIQEQDMQRLTKYLRTDPMHVAGITYHVYDTREAKHHADPQHSISRASARFDEYAIYRCWIPGEDPSFPHELTHLIAHRWGVPYQFTTTVDMANGASMTKTIGMLSTSFMQEGLALAVDEIFFQKRLHEAGKDRYVDDFCREYKEQMPTSLAQVINFEGFCSLPNEVVVPFTASFSKYLIGHYGIENYKVLYCQIQEVLSPQENIRLIENIYAVSEQELLNGWRETVFRERNRFM